MPHKKREPQFSTDELRRITDYEDKISEKHGMVIGGLPLAKLLGYRSPKALSMAIYRGTCPVHLKKVPGRREHVTTAREIATYLVTLEQP